MESITKYNNLSSAEKKIIAEILAFLKIVLKKDFDSKLIDVIYPPESTMGDYSVPMFLLAKKLKKNPADIANQFSRIKVTNFKYIKGVENEGPYLNFFVSTLYYKEVLSEIAKEQTDYGQLKKVKPKKIMVEYIQPNTHKEFHVGHLRNVCLGSAIVNILRNQGDNIISATYVNDFGLHVAQCIWGLEKFGRKEEDMPKNKGKYLGQIYAKASQEIRENESYRDETLELMKKLQDGEKKVTKVWEKTRKWSLDQFEKIYKEVGIKFDVNFLESQFFESGMKIVEKLKKQKLLKESQGAIIADLNKYNLGVLVFLRFDGTTLYPVADIPMAFEKFKKYKLDESYYVVDVRQSHYFEQLFKILEIMGLKKKTLHIKYEFVTLPDGAMASRYGRVILLDDLVSEVKKKAEQETKKRHPKWSNAKIKKTANAISWAAIKFGMLKQSNEKIIVFDIKKSLEFSGFTGPYLQYMHARINSIIKKAKEITKDQINFSKLNTQEERELIRQLSSYPQIVESSAKSFQPSILAQYLYDLASSFSTFYEKVPILKSDEQTKQARLYLVDQVKTVLATGLGLLNIQAPDEM